MQPERHQFVDAVPGLAREPVALSKEDERPRAFVKVLEHTRHHRIRVGWNGERLRAIVRGCRDSDRHGV